MTTPNGDHNGDHNGEYTAMVFEVPDDKTQDSILNRESMVQTVSEAIYEISEEDREEAPELSQKINLETSLPDFKNQSFEELNYITPVAVLTGRAGSGKTFLLQQTLLADPNYALLTSTTGISAVNLGATTINSALGYANIESLQDNAHAGFLRAKIAEIKSSHVRWLIIDEMSMLSKKAMDIIFGAIDDYNSSHCESEPLGMMLVGDLAQLPPIPDILHINGVPVIERGREKKEPIPWIFEGVEWPRFEEKMIKLQKIWRQSDPNFLNAVNSIRAGRGNAGADLLKRAGVGFVRSLDFNYDGTTIMAKNIEVDEMNNKRLNMLPGKVVKIHSSRWCARSHQPTDWKHVPEWLELKEGALVTVLVNNPPNFNYVNGDCGYVREFVTDGNTGEVVGVSVELIRTGEVITLQHHERILVQSGEPSAGEKNNKKVERKMIGRKLMWLMGVVKYMPLRLAWATTVHKSQGLSLDRVQINPNSWFFGTPNMCYVAVSRARSPEGLVVVGTPATLAGKVRVDPKTRRFI